VEPFAPYPGTGEIHEDPLFVNPANHNYRLDEGSPCRGTGRGGEDMGAIPYMTGVEELVEAELPERSLLSQNYPNPFNAATVIHYQLPTANHVRLEVYDLLGHRIASLVDSRQQAGEKRVIWDGSGFPSGVYFYRLTAGGFSDMNRMILLK